MTNFDLTKVYQHTGKSSIVGYVVEGSLDTGDYGNCPLVDIETPDEKFAMSIPANKLKEITREEYEDIKGLCYGLFN